MEDKDYEKIVEAELASMRALLKGGQIGYDAAVREQFKVHARLALETIEKRLMLDDCAEATHLFATGRALRKELEELP